MQASQNRCAPCPKSDAPLTLCSFCRETLDFPRSWLLPVLRDYVQGARLGFFTSYFLPLAATLKSRGEEQGVAGHWVRGAGCSAGAPFLKAEPPPLFCSFLPLLLQPWSLPRLGRAWSPRSMTRCSGR